MSSHTVHGPVHTAVEVVHDRIGDRLSHLHHSVARLRARLGASSEDSEWARQRVLFAIARAEPVRLGALAELVCADLSTLSRQVSALVKSGLVERQADPHDGRASLLVLSGSGRVAHRVQLTVRRAHYERMLADWTDEERDDFARLLERFTDDFDAYREAFARPAPADREEHHDQISHIATSRGDRP